MTTANVGGELHRVEHIMGMPIGIDVRDLGVDPDVLDQAFDWLRWVDATFSTYKADSEICRLNRGELPLADAHPDVRRVLARCDRLMRETGGYFDPYRTDLPPAARQWDPELSPHAVDPSGLVKGWSVDRAARILQRGGLRNFTVNAGGDLRAEGSPGDGPVWRIGIQHPYIKDRVAAVVGISGGAIATSGTYERGEHILDPHSGRPPVGLLSVTIVGPDLGVADAYATAAFAMGRRGPAWTATLKGYEAMTIQDDEAVFFTHGFPRLSDASAV
jgi:thiamine biosynthesis lipoprotein